MKQRAGPVVRLATPVKAWAQRFALFSLVLAAFALMLLSKTQSPLVERLRANVSDAIAPILDAVSQPVMTVNAFVTDAKQLATIRAENADLKARNERLLRWQAVARRLEAENESLRGLMNLVAEPAQRQLTARVIGDQGSAFVRSVLVNAGAREGIEPGQAAITGAGLAGRVVQVGNRAARVLLLTDMNSRIPVLIGRARDRAVLAGNNSDRPLLVHLAPRVEVRPGARVVTSGQGGLLPPDLPVGIVVEAGDGLIQVQPFADFDRMEHLRVVDYELARSLDISDSRPGPWVLPQTHNRTLNQPLGPVQPQGASQGQSQNRQ